VKLGLITDIHEDAPRLRLALNRFHREAVDQVVMIGDVVSMGQSLEETCRLLAEADAVGVWGNHDFELCDEPSPETCERWGSAIVDYMTSLKPRLDVAGCHFTHIELDFPMKCGRSIKSVCFTQRSESEFPSKASSA
jgi:hypothetical protein